MTDPTLLFGTVFRLAAMFVLSVIPAGGVRLWAQSNFTWSKTRLTHLGLDDNLSHRTVYSVTQDRDGFLWVGTQNGLNRYDGYTFTTFYHNPADPTSIAGDNVSSMAEDQQGVLWIATWGGGLNLFDPVKQSFSRVRLSFANGDPIQRVQKLYRDRAGHIWVGTYAAGVIRINPKTMEETRFGLEPPGVNQPARVWDMVEVVDNTFFMATNSGLWLLDSQSGRAQQVSAAGPMAEELKSAQIRALHLSENQYLWIGTNRHLFRLDIRDRSLVVQQPLRENGVPLEETNFNEITEDPTGNLLVGTLYHGMFRYDPLDGRWLQFQHNRLNQNGLLHNDIRALFVDRNDVLWIGTRGGGLSKLDTKRKKFDVYRAQPNEPNALPSEAVRALAPTADGGVWVGTLGGGLCFLNRKTGKVTAYLPESGNPRSISNAWVMALEKDPAERLWAGTNGGVNRLDEDGGFTRFQHDPRNPNSLIHDQVQSLAWLDDALWIGTTGGLSILRDGRFTNYPNGDNSNHGLGGTRIYDIHRDREGQVWLATAHGGLIRYRRESNDFRSYLPKQEDPAGISNATILCLGENSQGIWAGSFGGGLSLLPWGADTFTHFSTADGLPNNIVYAVLTDRADRLWISTNKGLCRFDPEFKTFRNYNVADGLQDELFSVGAYAVGPTGEFFFGGIEGFNSFYPSQVRDYGSPPNLALSEFRVMDRTLAIHPTRPEKITLPANENYLFFEFAALDFTSPEHNRYQYMLEGLDETWSRPDHRRSVNYAALAPGNYRFRVRAANHDGIWNEEGLAVRIRINPPFFLGKLAVVLYFLLGAGLIAGIGTLIVRKRRENEKISEMLEARRHAEDSSRSKSAFLAQMSHELRTPLNHIIGYSEILEEEVDDGVEDRALRKTLNTDLAKIRSAAFYQLSLINNLLDFTKIESGEVPLLLERFSVREMVESALSQVRPLLKKQANHLLVDYEPANPGFMVADMIKLRTALLNVLNNANKFTNRGQIHLRVTRSMRSREEWVTFEVTDTGIGIKEHQIEMLFREFTQIEDHNRYGGTGLGLYITRCFCKMMGGGIDVKSQYRKGTTFTMEIPVLVGNESKTISFPDEG
ncbi:ligand-binding sensor domain-containing protein [Acanthopleuribacter pedis]|uniref:histidine kinase n=1 Tax=Acanthopleuribacter pedis TaxID=442870 RepID=A0A8J7QDC7_9BACT|nr:sensor histidine kinase [Acanthopleuribacter pedis]MBO1322452.1 hypothetical protein [Acanthopleuribacter pedis]